MVVTLLLAALLLAALPASAATGAPGAATAAQVAGPSLDELRQARQSSYRQFQEARTTEERLRQRLLVARSQLARAESQLASTEARVRDAEAALADARARRGRAETALKVRQEQVGRWLRFLYEQGPVSYLEVLMGAADFADFVVRWETLEGMVTGNVQALREARSLQQRLMAEEGRVAARRQEVEALRVKAAEALTALRQRQAAQAQALAEARVALGQKAESLAALDRRWQATLPALQTFLSRFSRLPWAGVAPARVEVNPVTLSATAEFDEAGLNAALAGADPTLGGVRIALAPGQAYLESRQDGVFRLAGRLQVAGERRLAFRPVALDFLGVPVSEVAMAELVQGYDLSFDLASLGEGVRLAEAETADGTLRLRFRR